MFVVFEFVDCSNPYIALREDALWWMLTHYACAQIGEKRFKVYHKTKPPKTYREKQEAARQQAIEWQYVASDLNYSYEDLADWQDYFAYIGKRFGLRREFTENCIC